MPHFFSPVFRCLFLLVSSFFWKSFPLAHRFICYMFVHALSFHKITYTCLPPRWVGRAGRGRTAPGLLRCCPSKHTSSTRQSLRCAPWPTVPSSDGKEHERLQAPVGHGARFRGRFVSSSVTSSTIRSEGTPQRASATRTDVDDAGTGGAAGRYDVPQSHGGDELASVLRCGELVARDGVPVSARTRVASASSWVVLLLASRGLSKARSSRLARRARSRRRRCGGERWLTGRAGSRAC